MAETSPVYLANVRALQPQEREALERLIVHAKRDTGQSQRIADFLLAWWNAAAFGGFDLTNLWPLEIANQKIELVEGWLNSDQPLAGRAGKRIVKMRAHDFPDPKAMIRETAEMVSIRSTGHAWCLAQDEGCGGAGLYEPTRCAGCSDAVIDLAQRGVWQEIHSHQMGLLDEAAALGPATMQRVRRDLKRAEDVLVNLGWMPASRDA